MTAINHFVFIGIGAVSHHRQMLQLCLNLLDLHPSLVNTLLIADTTEPVFQSEYDLQPLDLIQRIKDRFRVKKVPTDGKGVFPSFKAVMGPVIGDLIHNQGRAQGDWSTVPCAFFVDVS